ncbi:hypothetical protein GGF46_001516 [Coemansia sp. RSA 552]|nr:hypothetical protein GGF46_001516 [Coemansia sp. RSA 552]
MNGTRSRATSAADAPASARQSPSAEATGPEDARSPPTPTQSDGAGPAAAANVSVPAQNIRQFKETVVNTSRLLKVFSDQEKELGKAKADLAKHAEEAKRMHTAYQGLTRELDGRTRDLAKANSETENARSLLLLREEELSRARGQKEDLEARIAEMKHTAPQVDSTPPKSPNTVLVEEVERLKRDLEAKDGSLKSLRISRDSIRSSTKAEIMAIQARYAREQQQLIARQEKEMADHRASLAAKEAELEQEQERLMQFEMDLGMRESHVDDQIADARSGMADATKNFHAAEDAAKKLADQLKARSAESRAEISRLQRAAKKSEKRIADLEDQLAKAREGARSARESARAKAKPRPRSTATAAEAIQAATEDVANMAPDELRAEVAGLRTDAVHQGETIRRLEVMVAELERKQNPEGSRPRARLNALEKDVKRLAEELEGRDQKIKALETALGFAKDAGPQGAGSESAEAPAQTAAAQVAQLNLRVIELETTVRAKDEAIKAAKSELKDAKEAANERPMRLRHAASTPGGSTDRTPAASTGNGRRGLRSSSVTQCTEHYTEIASLRSRVERLKQEKAALQELVTDQQVTIRQLRTGTSPTNIQLAPMLPSPTPAPRKRAQPTTLLSDRELARKPTPKRPRRTRAASPAAPVSDGADSIIVDISPKKLPSARTRRAALATKPSERSELREIERMLLDKRILSGTRARRCFGAAVSSPLELQTVLVRMDGSLLSIDADKLADLLLAHLNAMTAQPAVNGSIMPCRQPLDLPPAGPGEGGLLVAKLLPLAHGMQAGLYRPEADVVMSIWMLALRSEQPGFYDALMRRLSREVVRRSSYTVAGVCSFARVFAALGLLAADIQRVRVMLCDLLMDAVDSPHTLPVLANTLAVWPNVLALPSEQSGLGEKGPGVLSFSLVVRVFQAIAAGIHDLYKDENGLAEADELYSVMVQRCGWRQADDAEYADKLLTEVKSTLSSLARESTDFAVVMAAFNLLAPYVTS